MAEFNRNEPYNNLPLLPPKDSLETTKVLRKTIEASRALAELNGMLINFPNPTLFLDTIHLQEAKASSEIENIITTNDDLYRSIVATYSRSGKGVKRKLKAVNNLRRAESNYVYHRIHLYSRRLIDFCIKHQAGTLILLNQKDKIGIAKEEELVLRNWSYYELMTKIKYKAEMAGVELIIN